MDVFKKDLEIRRLQDEKNNIQNQVNQANIDKTDLRKRLVKAKEEANNWKKQYETVKNKYDTLN